MKAAQFWTAENVTRFQGWDVDGGEVTLSDSEYEEILNEIYGDVEVCGYTFGSGSLLVDADPTAFRCGKNDYESGIQTELESQLEREDDSDIEFEEELDEDEEEEDEE
jgi:hypothetical protein